MTDGIIDLPSMLEKTADPDFLREMIDFNAQRLMGLEVKNLNDSPHDARFPAGRLIQRNGYRERDWEACDIVEFPIPKLRKGSYFPSFL